MTKIEILKKKMMELDIEPVIGLETHIELNTKSKMFCACPNKETELANVYICPVCTWQIGVLPLPNKSAIEKTVKLWLALGAKISDIIDRDRKHYEYPDLPKGFQLTQLEHPIVLWWEVSCYRDDGSIFKVLLEQIHLEEDAGKLIHQKEHSLVDFNRAGRALIEIVTKPVIHRIGDAASYWEYLQKIVRSLDISGADMEKGHMRSDVSISLRKKWSTVLHARTELKNINSFKFAKDALIYEIGKQLTYREEHGKPEEDQVTALRDTSSKTTKVMRSKENAQDYRYIKEPDIPAVDISSLKSDVSLDLRYLPFVIEKKLVEVGLGVKECKFFSWEPDKTEILFAIDKKVWDLLLVAKTLLNSFRERDYTLDCIAAVSELLTSYKKTPFASSLLKKAVQTLLSHIWTHKTFDLKKFLDGHQVDETELESILARVIEKYDNIVKKVVDGDIKKVNVLVGEVMKQTQGKVAGDVVKERLLLMISADRSQKTEKITESTWVGPDLSVWVTRDIKTLHLSESWYRSHQLKDLDEKSLDKKVTISWRISTIRDHGDLVFVDLREDGDVFQIQFDCSTFGDVDQITQLSKESVIQVQWIITLRSKDDVHPTLRSGTIEVLAESLHILAHASPLPFDIKTAHKVREAKRLEYRHLSLRDPVLRDPIRRRYQVIREMRKILDKKWFVEVETPLLGKWTDEGSREFVVPSRMHEGQFYALPQAPQQFKQILMAAGCDKYFQIARCFRDEDDKGDRQPEFTQLDLEMAFTDEKSVMKLISQTLLWLVRKIYPEKKLLFPKIPQISYTEAMSKYGCDKPDLRFGLEMQEITSIVDGTSFKVFQKEIDQWWIVKALKVEYKLTKKNIEDLTKLAIESGIWWLAYIIVHEDTLQSPIVKFLGEDIAWKIVKHTKAQVGDTIFFSASSFKLAHKAFAAVRNELGKLLKLYDDDTLAFCWVVDFPMFEKTDDGKWKFTHNPFSMPKIDHLAWHMQGIHVEKIIAQQYDIVLNGHEIGGGSMRSHVPDILKATYKIMGQDKKQIMKSIGHMLKAFSFGTPPHGGIALGIDRIMMILEKASSIREVIPFPKTGSGEDLLFGAPGELSDEKLDEVYVKIKKKEERKY